jgi:hypothetical protein
MPAALAILLAATLTASAAPPDPDTVVSPLDVPGQANNKVVMAKPDRNGDKVICKTEAQPDSHLTKRTCVRRRDREAAAARQQQLITERQHRCDIVGAC